MKYLLGVIITFFAIECSGQNLKYINGQVVFSDTIVINRTQEELYDIIYNWIVASYEDVDRVVKRESREDGTIYLSGTQEAFKKKKNGKLIFKGWWEYDLRIDFQDGKYRYFLTNIRHVSYPENILGWHAGGGFENIGDALGGGSEDLWMEIKAVAIRDFYSLQQSLVNYIATQQPSSDW